MDALLNDYRSLQHWLVFLRFYYYNWHHVIYYLSWGLSWWKRFLIEINTEVTLTAINLSRELINNNLELSKLKLVEIIQFSLGQKEWSCIFFLNFSFFNLAQKLQVVEVMEWFQKDVHWNLSWNYCNCLLP